MFIIHCPNVLLQVGFIQTRVCWELTLKKSAAFLSLFTEICLLNDLHADFGRLRRDLH